MGLPFCSGPKLTQTFFKKHWPPNCLFLGLALAHKESATEMSTYDTCTSPVATLGSELQSAPSSPIFRDPTQFQQNSKMLSVSAMQKRHAQCTIREKLQFKCCWVPEGAGSQSVVSVCQHTLTMAFYRVAAKLCKTAQLCVFILGMWYFNLRVPMRVFRVR